MDIFLVLYCTLEANRILIPEQAETGEPGTAFVPAINLEPRKRLHRMNQRKALLIPCGRPQRRSWQKRRITETPDERHPEQRGPLEIAAWLRGVEQNNITSNNGPRASTPISPVDLAQQPGHGSGSRAGAILIESPSNNIPMADHEEAPARQVNEDINGGLPFFRAMDENAQLPPLPGDASTSSHDSGFHELDSSLLSQ